MNIVSNNILLRHFKRISIFQTDLGFNLTGPAIDKRGKGEQEKIKIKDIFIKKYQSINNSFIQKYGEIGTLKFYQDNSIETDCFHVWDDKDNIYEILMTEDDKSKDPATYLGEILQMIENGTSNDNTDMIEEENKKLKNVIYTNMPPEIIKVNSDLNPNDPEQKRKYIEQLIERRKIINNL